MIAKLAESLDIFQTFKTWTKKGTEEKVHFGKSKFDFPIKEVKCVQLYPTGQAGFRMNSRLAAAAHSSL